MWGIQRSPVNSPRKGQWRGALKFSLICDWINGWANNWDVGDLRRHCTHNEVTLEKQVWHLVWLKGPAFMKGIGLTPDLRIDHNLPVYNCLLQFRNLDSSVVVLIEKRLLPLFTPETLTESNITYIWCIVLCISCLISVAREPVQITVYLPVFAVPCWARHLWQSSTNTTCTIHILIIRSLSVIASHLKHFHNHCHVNCAISWN